MYFFLFIHDYIRRKAALSSGTSEDKMGAEYLDRAQRDERLNDNKDVSHNRLVTRMVIPGVETIGVDFCI